MSGGIFLVQNDTLVELEDQPFDSEDAFQTLLGKYPELLAGDQIDSNAPRRWLLVRREMGVPDEEGGGDRWSLDHLFLDQDGVPTLVEIKRSSDSRIRREVVGQMLDYAANAVVYWPVEEIRSQFTRRCEEAGKDPEAEMKSLLGDDADVDAFWSRVKTNLQALKVRMIFVADVIPPELRRIVEFLNEQMDPAEVLAVEIKRYAGSGLETLVPRVLGQTAEAQRKKGSQRGPARQWAEDSFFADLAKNTSEDAQAVIRKVYQWALDRKLRLTWGRGATFGSFTVIHPDTGTQLLWLSSRGYFGVRFVKLSELTAFESVEARHELRERLNQLPDMAFSEADIDKWPEVKLKSILGKNVCDLVAVLDWMLDRIKASGD